MGLRPESYDTFTSTRNRKLRNLRGVALRKCIMCGNTVWSNQETKLIQVQKDNCTMIGLAHGDHDSCLELN